VGQLFQTLDPLPFRERDLDAAVEEYIVGWAGELSPKGPLTIVLHLPAVQAEREEARHAGEAIRNFFSYRREALSWELRDLFRIGRTSLAVGLAVLGACTLFGVLLRRLAPEGYLVRYLDEGLLILGWVANWRPIEIFLYDWWPLARRRRLYGRLAQAQVQIAAADIPDGRIH